MANAEERTGSFPLKRRREKDTELKGDNELIVPHCDVLAVFFKCIEN